ncbi:MAG: sigma 54-interacting transcriptional regulator [Bacillota bacterium]|uniref:sigma-54 interaction domain-containing protein n=1 Tax=Bacillus sp. RO2 TaxID=2723913 RepID=UPI00145DEF11|nr:sigma 54-interacting transcriptional regulator [Bacillus sp. RO2]MEA3319190.1 sigma 54-interacting transcriptional regulator [Bacillota bacterium]NMH73024.1 sigma 54-interacting transcriptional regulator [Bacillus sp. RO2]
MINMQTHTLSKEMLMAILDGIDEAIHAVDKDGFTIYYNKVAAGYDGMKVEEVLGKHLLHVFPSLTEETSTLLKVLKTKTPIYHENQRYENKKGQLLETVNTTIPILKGDNLLGAVEIAKNYGHLNTLSNKLMDLQAKINRSEGTKKISPFQASYTLDDFITDDPDCVSMLQDAMLFASSLLPVVIWGETGTGKEIIAQGIHHHSPRKRGPFIAQNCGAIPATLLESILFGTEKGSYTGAVDRKGLFELASGGTLFLDEMNSMPLELQAKLLRVLEDGSIRRVGGTATIKVDVRIITAMNESPETCVDNGSFRDDLYYRLNTCPIYIPPLRERPQDIRLLLEKKLQARISYLLPHAIGEMFRSYHWPGNVRELINTIEYVLLKSKNETISTKHLPAKLNKIKQQSSTLKNLGSLRMELQKTEESMIQNAMVQTGGNVMKAAKILDIPRQTLQYKLAKMVEKSNTAEVPKIRHAD